MKTYLIALFVLTAASPAFAELPVFSVLINQSGSRSQPLTEIKASLWTCSYDLSEKDFDVSISTAEPPFLRITLKQGLTNDCGNLSRLPRRILFKLSHLPVLQSVIFDRGSSFEKVPVYHYQLN